MPVAPQGGEPPVVVGLLATVTGVRRLSLRREAVPLHVLSDPLRHAGRRHRRAAEQRLQRIRAPLEVDGVPPNGTLFSVLGFPSPWLSPSSPD